MAKTFATARNEILPALASLGWSVAANLKVPHATSPDGKVRLWFKPQALHLSVAEPLHKLGNARTLFYLDIRKVDAARVIEEARRMVRLMESEAAGF